MITAAWLGKCSVTCTQWERTRTLCLHSDHPCRPKQPGTQRHDNPTNSINNSTKNSTATAQQTAATNTQHPPIGFLEPFTVTQSTWRTMALPEGRAGGSSCSSAMADVSGGCHAAHTRKQCQRLLGAPSSTLQQAQKAAARQQQQPASASASAAAAVATAAAAAEAEVVRT